MGISGQVDNVYKTDNVSLDYAGSSLSLLHEGERALLHYIYSIGMYTSLHSLDPKTLPMTMD